nr:hypothetical protein [Tanacetum cinerariifolium]
KDLQKALSKDKFTFKRIIALMTEYIVGGKFMWTEEADKAFFVLKTKEYQVLTCEIEPTLKPLEEIIQENFFCLRERKPRKDRGTRRGRHSTSSSTCNEPSSSHLNDDDDDDDDGNNEGTSRASTPSPIRYVNLLTNKVTQVLQNPPNIDPHLEPFYIRQTEIINRQVQIRDQHRGGLRGKERTSAMLSLDATFSLEMFPLDIVSKETVTYLRCVSYAKIIIIIRKKTNVDGDDEVDNVKTYGGSSGNSGGKRLAISMVEEAWLSEKEEM